MFLVLSLIVVLECLFTGLILTPIGWMLLVWALWNMLFGIVILLLQFGVGRSCITKNAGFLDTRIGRSMFYLYCGVVAGATANTNDAHLPQIITSYVCFVLLWYVGLFELCAPSKRDQQDSAGSPSATAEVQPTLQPLGASLCGSGPRSDAVTISVTPNEAAQAAKFVGRNVAALTQTRPLALPQPCRCVHSSTCTDSIPPLSCQQECSCSECMDSGGRQRWRQRSGQQRRWHSHQRQPLLSLT